MHFQMSDICACCKLNANSHKKITKSGSLSETNLSCRNTLQKEYYNKREQNNKILFKVQDLNL